MTSLTHGDILHINGRNGGFFRVYTIEGFYAARLVDRESLRRRYPDSNLGQPQPWEGSLEAYKAHNRECGGQDFGLSEEALVIASDGLSMFQRYAQHGQTVIKAEFGDTVTLNGRTYTLGKDRFNQQAKLVA